MHFFFLQYQFPLYLLSPLNTFTSAFFIFSTTLTIFFVLSSSYFYFLYPLLILLLLLLLNPKLILLSLILGFHYYFLLLFFNLVSYLVYLLFLSLFLVHVSRWNQILTNIKPILLAYNLVSVPFIKYSKFLWSIQILNLNFTSYSKCLQFSKPLITTNIFLS